MHGPVWEGDIIHVILVTGIWATFTELVGRSLVLWTLLCVNTLNQSKPVPGPVATVLIHHNDSPILAMAINCYHLHRLCKCRLYHLLFHPRTLEFIKDYSKHLLRNLVKFGEKIFWISINSYKLYTSCKNGSIPSNDANDACMLYVCG